MSQYNFFEPTDIAKAKLIPESLAFTGGAIDCSGGLLVDGNLTKVTLESKDGSPIYISALATLDDCIINGRDVLIEGHFSGVINADGKTEFASGCVVVGVFNKAGEVYMHKLADVDDLAVKSKKPSEQSAQLVKTQMFTVGSHVQPTGTGGSY
jgi:hypothetical protein